ncbi:MULTISPECIES: tyrosine-protein phosphatase [Acidithrix]|uniref:Tyrosine-protein phosphatase n=1 Tax=Acidithrix ferrooxidans TaxID=1280514 RepID=A0A0D8HF41_9ACTN|nr:MULTISPECIES: tyrosine-protein phosphatase [Acidithrix]KJF16489.1 tyrosine-protein phosphatase precursor [Acidithrix ferrooxidans]CAG4928974.1 unnamed protein product [Acidithrix sp. C25]
MLIINSQNTSVYLYENYTNNNQNSLRLFSFIDDPKVLLRTIRQGQIGLMTTEIISLTKFESIELKFEAPIDHMTIFNFEFSDGKSQELAMRHIKLEGATNFRDAGGYAGLKGIHMPWRRYFRSDNLANLTESDLKVLSELKISTIYDLRRDQERELSPTRLLKSSEIEIIEVPITSTIADLSDALPEILAGKLSGLDDNHMCEMYQSIVDTHLDDLLGVASAIIANEQDNVIFHCTAGKDRTGILAALIQLSFGVDQETIFHDFLLSNRYRTPLRMKTLEPHFLEHSIDIQNFKPYLSAPYEALESIFDELIEAAETIDNPNL